jgi:hypothetical protein
MTDSDLMARLAAVEREIQELKAMQDLTLRLLSVTRPIAGLVQYYGATESQEHALYRLLDEMVVEFRGPTHRHPTFGDFRTRLAGIFPALRGDREFVQLLIDTLKIERPAYRELHRFLSDRHWPVWD